MSVDHDLIERLVDADEREAGEGGSGVPVAPVEGEARGREDDDQDDAPGASSEPADDLASWRARADAAEARLAEFAVRLADADAATEELRAALTGAARARRIDVELMRGGARDLDAARRLVDDDEDDPCEAVRRAIASNPAMFAGPVVGRRGGALAASIERRPGRRREAIADAARQSGDRRLLLRYLRVRRTG